MMVPWVVLIVAAMIVASVGALILMNSESSPPAASAPSSAGDVPTIGGGDYTGTNAGLRPSKFSMFGRFHYYQIPPNPKGTFVYFPGCAHSPLGFWPHHPQLAPELNGFPEDVARTKQALRNGYAMLVPMARNQKDLCMNMTNGDFEQVGPIMNHFLTQNGLANKPVFIGGASSGGGLAVRLPGYFESTNQKIRIDGMILEVATNNSPLKNGKLPIPNFPPVVYIVMERDTASHREAQAHSDGLRKLGVPSAIVKSPKRSVHPLLFSDRSTTVSPALSRKIVAALRSAGAIDAGGQLRYDPAENKSWMAAVRRVVPNTKEYHLGAVRSSPLLQVLTVAYARHEQVSDYTTAAIKYLESGGKASMPDLVAAHRVDVPAALTVA
jgi:hypothetical protein